MERPVTGIMTSMETLQSNPTPALSPSHIETPSGKNKETENFPVGSVLIRPDLRHHVHAFYIFARAADDISDNPLLDPADKIARLNLFAAALANPEDNTIPSVTPLRKSLAETGITPQHSLDLLAAFKRDATQLRYKDWADLLDYCRYSASPVGRHVLALHGVGQAAWPANDALCSALQIINHIQDCADDYREHDRVYLPQDMLLATGANPADLSRPQSPPELRATLDAMLEKLLPMLAEARLLPRNIPDWRLKLETSIICSLAEKLITLLQKRDPLSEPVKLSKGATFRAGVSGILRAWL